MPLKVMIRRHRVHPGHVVFKELDEAPSLKVSLFWATSPVRLWLCTSCLHRLQSEQNCAGPNTTLDNVELSVCIKNPGAYKNHEVTANVPENTLSPPHRLPQFDGIVYLTTF